MWAPLAKSAGKCPSLTAKTLTWQQILFSSLSWGSWQGQFYKLDCKLTCGSFQRGNSISLRSVCFSQIKHSSRYRVFWAGCYQRIDGAENEIRRVKIAGRWPNRGEASRCDSTIKSCCIAISQPGGCQLSTTEATNTHFIFMAFLAWCRSHHHTLAAVRQPYGLLSGMLSAVCCGSKKGVQWVNGREGSERILAVKKNGSVGLSTSHCANDGEDVSACSYLCLHSS